MNRASLVLAPVVLLGGVDTKRGPADESAANGVPPERIPAFEGVRYEILVPDTLDLAERVSLSINGLTRCVDGPPANPFPPTRYVCNHFIAITPWPKVLRNVTIYGKFMESTLLARMITGSTEGIHVDEDWRRAWLAWSRIDPVMHGPEGGRRLCWIAAGGDMIDCTVDGKKTDVTWEGRYLDLGAVRPGRSYTLRFPVEIKRIERDIGRRRFALTVKGRTVIGVDPPGSRIPLYQRKRYLDDKAPLVKVRRYIPAWPFSLPLRNRSTPE